MSAYDREFADAVELGLPLEEAVSSPISTVYLTEVLKGRGPEKLRRFRRRFELDKSSLSLQDLSDELAEAISDCGGMVDDIEASHDITKIASAGIAGTAGALAAGMTVGAPIFVIGAGAAAAYGGYRLAKRLIGNDRRIDVIGEHIEGLRRLRAQVRSA